MTVRNIDKFKRHFCSTFNGVKITTGSAETAFASKGDGFNMTAVFAAIDNTAIAVVTAMYHFFDVFVNNIAYGDMFVFEFMKILFEDLL